MEVEGALLRSIALRALPGRLNTVFERSPERKRRSCEPGSEPLPLPPPDSAMEPGDTTISCMDISDMGPAEVPGLSATHISAKSTPTASPRKRHLGELDGSAEARSPQIQGTPPHSKPPPQSPVEQPPPTRPNHAFSLFESLSPPRKRAANGTSSSTVVVGNGSAAVVSPTRVTRSSPGCRAIVMSSEKLANGVEEMNVEDKEEAMEWMQEPRIGPEYQVWRHNIPVCDVQGPDPSLHLLVLNKGLVFTSHGDRRVDDDLCNAFEGSIRAFEETAQLSAPGEAWEAGYIALYQLQTEDVMDATHAALKQIKALEWTEGERDGFCTAIYDHDKNFERIQQYVPDRTLGEVIAYYYRWKMTSEYREWKAKRPQAYLEQTIPDYHSDLCDVCDRPGELLCCDTCNLAFHYKCLRMKENKIPKDFSCAACLRTYTDPHSRERARRWVEREVAKVEAMRKKEEERLQEQAAGYIAKARGKSYTVAQPKKRRRRRVRVILDTTPRGPPLLPEQTNTVGMQTNGQVSAVPGEVKDDSNHVGPVLVGDGAMEEVKANGDDIVDETSSASDTTTAETTTDSVLAVEQTAEPVERATVTVQATAEEDSPQQ